MRSMRVASTWWPLRVSAVSIIDSVKPFTP
jgi:hypothetical protein